MCMRIGIGLGIRGTWGPVSCENGWYEMIMKNVVYTGDRVDVVRCVDCKYGNLCFDAFGHRLIQCTNPNCPASMETWPLELDWYCAGGERRDDNGEDA